MSMREALARSFIWPMLRKEFIQMRRDRVTLAMMIGIPAIQLMLFGYAIRTEVRHLPTIVLDESQSQESRALVDVMTNTQDFDIVGTAPDRAAISDALGSGRAAAALVIPPSFERDIKAHRTAYAQMIVDAADPMASAAAMSGAAMAGAARAAEIAARRGPIPSPLEVRVRPLYNPALRTSAYIVPGIIGVLLSMTMLIMTSMAIVRERERGTLEQLVVTPIGKTSLMLGKILPFVLVGYVQMTVVLLLGKALFAIPIRGSIVELYLASLPFIVASLGIGLVISTMAETQLQAMQLGFFLMMPMILLSGFMFPRAAMPAFAQWLGLLMPISFFLEILRGILLKGVGITLLWRQLLVLVVFALVLVTIAVRRFHKTVE